MNKFSLILVGIFVTIVAGHDGTQEERSFFKPWTLVDVPGLGLIQGFLQKTALTKREYPAFTGIPYGNIVKRFLPAEPVTKLTKNIFEVFDATKPQAPCMQVPNAIVPGSAAAVEQCLSLNVFTPAVKSIFTPWLKPKPVIVFIHGGSFTRWSGNMWGGQRLLERDAVFVTINYRLGPLGFLTLGTDEAPGNAGMYDMILALEWVQKHISHFGGDPTRVTIAGQSAGAASVSWILDSPLGKNLFRSAIALSGADVDAWAIQPNPIPAGLLAAKALNCSDIDMNQIVECLRNVPAIDFNQILQTSFYSAPIVQDFPLTKVAKFAPFNPAVSMALGQHNTVPLMIGTTKNDGSFLLSRFYATRLRPYGLENNAAFLKYQFLPTLFKSLGLVDSPAGYFNQIAATYLGEAATSGNFTLMTPGLIDIFSAFYFKMGALIIANYHASLNSDIYLYSFDYFGTLTYYPYIGGVPEIPRGSSHVDDLMYLIYLGEFTRVEDFKISLMLVDAWVNFATTGNPNKRTVSDELLYNVWPKYDIKSHEFIKLNVVPSEDNNYSAYWFGASNNIQG